MRSERKHNKMDVSDQCFHCFINGLPLELGIWKEDKIELFIQSWQLQSQISEMNSK